MYIKLKYAYRIFKLNYVNIFMFKDHYFLHVNYSCVNRHFHIQFDMFRMFFLTSHFLHEI